METLLRRSKLFAEQYWSETTSGLSQRSDCSGAPVSAVVMGEGLGGHRPPLWGQSAYEFENDHFIDVDGVGGGVSLDKSASAAVLLRSAPARQAGLVKSEFIF